MRIHGLVLLVICSLSRNLLAQSGTNATSQEPLRPVPSQPNALRPEPDPVSSPPLVAPEGQLNIDAELKQFRNELKDFQTFREEVARSTKAAVEETDSVALKQRMELLDLLTKLAKKNMARKAVPAVPAQPEVPPTLEDDFDQPDPKSLSVPLPQPNEPFSSPKSSELDENFEAADPFALGKVLFRAGDFVGAEKAFRKATVSPENEMTLKYLLATCLRRQAQWKPAIDAYTVIVQSNQDPVLRDLAKWQIDNIRWHQKSESQLELLRRQREKRQDTRKNASANPARTGR